MPPVVGRTEYEVFLLLCERTRREGGHDEQRRTWEPPARQHTPSKTRRRYDSASEESRFYTVHPWRTG
jgi:hypothetical protein